jgi:hypothetical protein
MTAFKFHGRGKEREDPYSFQIFWSSEGISVLNNPHIVLPSFSRWYMLSHSKSLKPHTATIVRKMQPRFMIKTIKIYHYMVLHRANLTDPYSLCVKFEIRREQVREGRSWPGCDVWVGREDGERGGVGLGRPDLVLPKLLYKLCSRDHLLLPAR